MMLMLPALPIFLLRGQADGVINEMGDSLGGGASTENKEMKEALLIFYWI